MFFLSRVLCWSLYFCIRFVLMLALRFCRYQKSTRNKTQNLRDLLYRTSLKKVFHFIVTMAIISMYMLHVVLLCMVVGGLFIIKCYIAMYVVECSQSVE